MSENSEPSKDHVPFDTNLLEQCFLSHDLVCVSLDTFGHLCKVRPMCINASRANKDLHCPPFLPGPGDRRDDLP